MQGEVDDFGKKKKGRRSHLSPRNEAQSTREKPEEREGLYHPRQQGKGVKGGCAKGEGTVREKEGEDVAKEKRVVPL